MEVLVQQVWHKTFCLQLNVNKRFFFFFQSKDRAHSHVNMLTCMQNVKIKTTAYGYVYGY